MFPWLLLLLGCPADDGPPTTASTPSALVHGDCPEGQPEELCERFCNDGVDNDGDGLLDCEDPSCFEAVGCVETDCTDGEDDDLDGLVDCRDMDCWDGVDRGPCSPVVWVYREAASIAREAHYAGVPASGSCPASFGIRSEVVTVRQPAGHLALGPQATVACDWTAASSELAADYGTPNLERRVRELSFADAGCDRFSAELATWGRARLVGDTLEVDIAERTVWTAPRAASSWTTTSQTMPTYPSTSGYCSRGLLGSYAPVSAE